MLIIGLYYVSGLEGDVWSCTTAWLSATLDVVYSNYDRLVYVLHVVHIHFCHIDSSLL